MLHYFARDLNFQQMRKHSEYIYILNIFFFNSSFTFIFHRMFIYILDSFVYTLLFPLSLNNSFINFNRDHGSLEYLLCKMKTYYIYICIFCFQRCFNSLIKSLWEKWGGGSCYRCFIEANNEANTIIILAR